MLIGAGRDVNMNILTQQCKEACDHARLSNMIS
jgi:hypothetical protein